MNNATTALVSLAGLVTAVAALLTVREMVNQRRSAYRPEIVGVGCTFTIERLGVQSPYRWREDVQLGRHRQVSYEDDHDLSVRIFNIGKGAAQSISWEWSWDLEQVIEQIHKADTAGDWSINVTASEALGRPGDPSARDVPLIEVRGPGKEESFTVLLDNKGRLHYLLPAGIDGTPGLVPLPTAYMDLHAISASVALPGRAEPLYPSPCPLTLSLTYRDIGGSQLRRRIKVTLDIWRSLTRGDLLVGELEVEPLDRS